MRPSLVLLATLAALSALPAHAGPLKLRPHAVETHQSRSMDRSGELNMIQVQSLVSQRQQALHLVSNMLQGQQETRRKIIGNIGGGCGDKC